MSRSIRCLVISGLLIPLAIPAAASAKTVTISVWADAGDAAARKNVTGMVTQFEKTHPGIKVKLTIGDHNTFQEKFPVAAAGGASPDVFNVNMQDTETWAYSGLLRSLDSYMKASNIKASDYLEACMDNVTINGQVYGLPMGTDTRGLVWDKGMFSKAGLDPNKGPETWADLKAYHSKLTKTTNGTSYSQTGFLPWLDQSTQFLFWGWQNRGEFVNLKTWKLTADDPKNVEALEFLRSLVVPYGSAALNRLGSVGTGKVAMQIGGIWHVPGLRDPKIKYQPAVGELPYPAGGKKVNLGGGFGWTITKGSKHPKEAWEFVRWVTGVEGGKTFYDQAGGVPANLKVLNWVTDKADPMTKVFLKMASYTRQYPTFPGMNTFIADIGTQMNNVFFGKTSPADALRNANKNAQIVLDRTRARRAQKTL